MPADQDTAELKLLACDADLALISCSTPALAHSLLVQVVRLSRGPHRSVSLYVVYREAGMTFEATAPFAIDDGNARLNEVLARFIGEPDFENIILRPLQDEVRRHFRR